MPATIDTETRSVGIIAATENPVMMPDWERMEMVPEVLLMSGIKLPESRKVPLLNSHDRFAVESVIGSATELEVNDRKLVGKAVFASAADGAFSRVKEGHVTDLSVGYSIEKRRYVPEKTTERIGGKEFVGPVNVATSWRVREVSLTPIGADEQAKMRGLAVNPFGVVSRSKGITQMNEKFKSFLLKRGLPANQTDEQITAWLISKGMPKETDTDDMYRWAVENLDEVPVMIPSERLEVFGERIITEDLESKIAKAVAEEARKMQEKLQEQEAIRTFVNAECKRLGLSKYVDEIMPKATTMVDAGRAILDKMAIVMSQPEGLGRFDAGESQRDKHVGLLRTALLMRVAGNVPQSQRDNVIQPAERKHGWEEFRHANLSDLARECLVADGINVRGASRQQIALCALGDVRNSGLQVRDGAAYHVTASFPNLVLDAINKSMLAGYNERNFTWRLVFRQAASVPDFKNIHRVRLSEVPNLKLWLDNVPPEEFALTDEREYYAVEAYAEMVSFSWKLLVNDDMDALTRTPAMMGTAAARTINAAVWSIVTSNPTMTDGQALFATATGNRKKTNYTSSGTAISETSLNVARNLFRQQVGVNTKGGNASESILNLEPRALVVPSAIEGTARRQINSDYVPEANMFQTVNQFKSLAVVVEPLLDANSATAWYLFAGTDQIDTIELSFLQGFESPQTSDWLDMETSARKYTIKQCYGAKAIDWRGCYKNAGA